MSSILTNMSANLAISNLRRVDKNISSTQSSMATGKSITNSKENSSYFGLSEKMNGDSGIFKSISESLTLTQNSLATARHGAEKFVDLAKEFSNRAAFFATEHSEQMQVVEEMQQIAKRMQTVIDQSTFNGDNLLQSTSGTWNGETWVGTDERQVVSGVSRANGSFETTTILIHEMPIQQIQQEYETLANGLAPTHASWTPHSCQLVISEAAELLDQSIDCSTSLGQDEKSIERQKYFISKIVDEIDLGVGSMVDADMEAEAAKLQAYQIQQQLAGQSVSLANKSPQAILNLFG